jgi:hypothetical protein
MPSRRNFVLALLLVLAGAGAWVFVVRPLLGPQESEWDAQIAQDAAPLTQVLRYDLRVKDASAIDAAWEKRRALYDESHLAKLRETLLAFVEFQVAEYADAKEAYLAGRDPSKPSAQALVAQSKLRDAFGPVADEMIAQYKERVREAAYRASPVVGGGADPNLPRYDAVYDDLVSHWLPQARASVERLTSPAR